MQKHYNIYYLFLDDKEKHPIPKDTKEQILKNIEKFYQKIKPP